MYSTGLYWRYIPSQKTSPFTYLKSINTPLEDECLESLIITVIFKSFARSRLLKQKNHIIPLKVRWTLETKSMLKSRTGDQAFRDIIRYITSTILLNTNYQTNYQEPTFDLQFPATATISSVSCRWLRKGFNLALHVFNVQLYL